MTTANWSELASELKSKLKLQSAPIAITFSMSQPAGIRKFEGPTPDPMPDGRTGKVPAGCVFWMKAADRSFTTVPDDHGNCSVGSLTHGLKSWEEISANGDVSALLESGWVSMDVVPQIPVVKTRYAHITYGPLEQTTLEPDVILLRVNATQLMILHDAIPTLRFEGKPQCHIIAIAKEQRQVAASVGCMLSRVRTGMPPTEVTCAIPASTLTDVVHALATTCTADGAVAQYAAEDSKRFS
jgi:uncharacterized protein (DUF169 family)